MPHPQSAHKTIVITGGTDGMGRAVALARLARGDTVIVVGSSAEKGAALTRDAGGDAGRLHYIQADLSSLKAVQALVESLAAHPVIDALVLCANRQSPRRVETAEGLEFCFSLYYLSRYLLGHGLRAQFDQAAAPVIINVTAPGTKMGDVNFDDLQQTRKYSGLKAQTQACRANDLLGAAYGTHPSSKAHYVLYHPGFTATRGGLEHMKQPVKAIVGLLAKVAAKPVDKAVEPIIEFIDSPPAPVFSAVDRGKYLDVDTFPTFDKAKAARLAEVTARLVTSKLGTTQLVP
ncbi:SDR family NAD(P)-dependent oxidoreductase [Actinocorallia aurantiaca]|uniref:NAD(P)-dependent dehydrogenase (Short-subunit alcohol dehydrogenase family) n=1 Tax=Actinocorallia aurantiaca TaxID=46204 RepID=A0ABP6GS16_9ACTN